MDEPTVPRPTPDEYAPHYAGYIEIVAKTDLRALLERQCADLETACQALSERDARFRYAPQKWSIKEAIGHVSDTERIFAYRALRIARADTTPLAGFDENAYVSVAGFDHRPLADLLREFRQVRSATLVLLESMAPETWGRCGVANGQVVSVRALAYIIAGHAQHHLRLLGERYKLSAAVAMQPPS